MAVIWWENTMLGVMLDVEAKQQVLKKGSKGKDVHPGPRLWALSKQGGQEGEEVPQEGTVCPPGLPLSSGDSSTLFTRREHRFIHKPFLFKCLKAKCRKVCSAS